MIPVETMHTEDCFQAVPGQLDTQTYVTRQSPFSRRYNTFLYKHPITLMIAASKARSAGKLIQDAYYFLDAEEREFIQTGITPDEWKATFGE
jgi:hypothetical protein